MSLKERRKRAFIFIDRESRGSGRENFRSAFLKKWKIELVADTSAKAAVLGKTLGENGADRFNRESTLVLILWEEESHRSFDGSVENIGFAVLEGPDCDESKTVKAGLALLNLDALFKKRR